MARIQSIAALLLTVIVVSMVTVTHGNNYLNACTVGHEGCSYKLVLADKDCVKSVKNSHNSHTKRRGISRRSNALMDMMEPLPDDGQGGDMDGEELDLIPAKSMEKLERNLKRMMEAFSVRSLRHMRNMKAELRQMSSTMNQMKTKSGKNLKYAARQCPPEFVTVGTWGSCYRFSTFNSTWHEAREYCSAVGANLLALDTLKEAYIMDYLIKSTAAYQVPNGWWTSGNYIVRNRKWMWTSKLHLKPITFSRWAPGEPDARSTMHCMSLSRDARYMWHDALCTNRNNFICEIQLV